MNMNWRKIFDVEMRFWEEPSRFALNFKEKDWEDVYLPTSYEEVLEQVILAQIASDGGKKIPRFKGMNALTERAFIEGYDVKDRHILSAILGILALDCKDSINFFIESDYNVVDDGWGAEMYSIIYFEWRGFQISFHSFSPVWKKVHDLFGAERTVWDEGSSPFSCLKMMEELAQQGQGMWGDCVDEIESLLVYAEDEDDRLEDVILVKKVDGVTARQFYPEIGVRHSYTMVELWEGAPYFVTT